MNRERAAELLPIIHAFAEGKEIQWRAGNDCNWQTYGTGTNSVLFDDGGEYRIKPEPREFWIIPETGHFSNVNPLNTCGNWIKVREIIE